MSPDEASFQVDLAEYNALRAEIQTFLTLQSAFLGLAVAIIAAVIPIMADRKDGTLPWILAFAPLPFALLATLYADVIARIARAARFVDTKLRPRLARQTAHSESLGWESYVHVHDPNKHLLWWTDKIRYAIFSIPAILAYGAAFFRKMGNRWDLFFEIVNGAALIGAAAVIWRSEVTISAVATGGPVSKPKK